MVLSQSVLRASKARAYSASTLTMLALMSSGAGYGQTPATDRVTEVAATQPVSDIVVTGSRITRNGFSAPTPTSVVSAAEIRDTALPNIADVVNQLPQLQGSSMPTVGNRASSAGQGGGNILNLRGLGIQRTLVLLDGRRVVPTAGTGVTDANNLPSQLVQRVDIVTGGASAVYGSDAVAGVVNFILDKNFTGLKATLDGGISSRNDDAEEGGSLTYGGHFLDNRLHLLFSAEYLNSAGIPLLDPSKRSWYQGIRQINNPAFVSRALTPNVPALITVANVNHALAAPGGLITSGPLRGTQFGVNGSVFPFIYGSPISGQTMVGGQHEDTAEEIAFATPVDRANLFGRVTYDISDTVSAFAQFDYGRSHAEGAASARGRFFGNLTISRANPYLPASIVSALTAANAVTFGYGLNSADLGLYEQINTRRTSQGTVGLNGKLFGAWAWNAYYQYGRSDVTNITGNNLILQNFRNAIDVVAGPGGTPTCRSIVANPSCVPLNIFGIGVASPAALNYITGDSRVDFRLVQQVAEASLSGEPFHLWAGPVSLVVGAGYRREEITTPYVDARSLADQWATANYKPTNGTYNVKEVFGETVIPLAKDFVLAKSLEFNGAVRLTSYSTSGTVVTWKAGLNYRPVSDILFRGNLSRDIRAPSLTDLYAGGTVQLQPQALDPKYGNQLVAAFPNAQTGNPNLKPEKSDAMGAGAVYQPSWLPGFNVSVDYYRIKIQGGILNVPLQNVINDCYSGVHPEYCAFVTRGPGFVGGVAVPDTIIAFKTSPVNLAAFRATGLDIEGSYTKNLSDWVAGSDASFSLRSLATHIISNSQDNGLGVIHERAGEVNNQSNTPYWRVNTMFTYRQGPVTFSTTWRWTSAGVLSTSFYDTSTGPLTVDNNRVPSVSYVDVGLSYKFQLRGMAMELYGRITNLLDKDPPVVASTNLFDVQYNPALYDGIGRYYRMGLRLKL